jgi:hypothetical protein
MTDSRTPWPRAWTGAIALAVTLAAAHSTGQWWLPALVQVLFGDVPQSVSDITPGVAWVLIVWIMLSLAGGAAISLLFFEGVSARDRHRWRHEAGLTTEPSWRLPVIATRMDERAAEILARMDERARLAQIEDALWLESLPPERRAAILRRRQQAAEREARARAILAAERQAHQNGETRQEG